MDKDLKKDLFRDIYSASRVHEKRSDKIKSQHAICFKNKTDKFKCRNSWKLKDEDVRKKTYVIPDLWKGKWSTLLNWQKKLLVERIAR